MATNMNTEIDWDTPIEVDAGFEVIPAGEYNFKVKLIEKARHEPTQSGKLPSCPMAIVTLEIDNNGKTHTANHRLFLHESTIGFVSAFFASIGQKKKGVPLVPDWNAAIGSTGRLKAKVEQYKGEDQNKFTFISSESKSKDKKVGW